MDVNDLAALLARLTLEADMPRWSAQLVKSEAPKVMSSFLSSPKGKVSG